MIEQFYYIIVEVSRSLERCVSLGAFDKEQVLYMIHTVVPSHLLEYLSKHNKTESFSHFTVNHILYEIIFIYFCMIIFNCNICVYHNFIV